MSAGVCMYLGSLVASAYYHKILVRKVFSAPMSFFDTTPLGNVLNRIGNDIYNIDQTIPGAFGLLVNLLVNTVASITVI